MTTTTSTTTGTSHRTTRRTSHRTARRTTAGRRTRATFATLVVAVGLGALTACGGAEEAGETTCGEYSAYSAAERRAFIRDAAQTDESVDAETRELIESATDDQVDVIAAEFITACEREDDDTALDDIE